MREREREREKKERMRGREDEKRAIFLLIPVTCKLVGLVPEEENEHKVLEL